MSCRLVPHCARARDPANPARPATAAEPKPQTAPRAPSRLARSPDDAVREHHLGAQGVPPERRRAQGGCQGRQCVRALAARAGLGAAGAGDVCADASPEPRFRRGCEHKRACARADPASVR